jgi:hypothetical protein
MQTMRRACASISKPLHFAAAAWLVWIPLGLGVSAQTSAQTAAQEDSQEQPASTAAPVIPQQVRYAGKLAVRAGDTVEAVFRIYAAEEGGEPLWTEMQRVTVAGDGSYTVLLGSASPTGLPQAVFSEGAARWLGISVERTAELERVPLSSVPYAMKSADAESLGGHAAADFVTQAQLAGRQAAVPAPEAQPDTSGTVTGSGTAGTFPLWTGALTQGNSEIVQVGSDIGIHEATPGATLDVGGTATIRGATTIEGTTTLPPQAPATTASGYASQLLDLSASAWSSTTVAPVNQTFRLFSYPTGNNTATPSGTLFFQFQEGTGPVANILTIASNGVIGFNAAQTFPGTIKSVSGASPVTAATTAGAVTVGLNTPALETTLNGVYAQLGAANTFTKPITFAPGQTFPIQGTGGGTITGITTTSPLTGSGTSGSVALGLNTGALLSAITPPLETTFNTIYPQLNAQNSFSNTNTFAGTIDSQGTIDLESPGVTSSFAPNLNSALLELSANAYNSTEGIPEALKFGWQAVATGGNSGSPSANLELLYGSGSTQPAATGLTIAPSGIITFASGQTFPGGGGGSGIAGITSSSPLTGSGTSGTVNLGLNTSVLETTLDAVYSQLAAANSFSSTQTVTTSATPAINAIATGSASTGVSGSGTSYGVYGTSASTGVYGFSSGGGAGVWGAGKIGVYAYGTQNGISSSSSGSGGAAVSSDDTSGSGVGVLGASGTLPAVQAGTGIQGTGSNYGVYGSASTKTGFGVAGVSTSDYLGTAGVYGSGVYGVWGAGSGLIGVLGQFGPLSQTFQTESTSGIASGIWGDASSDEIGVIATADEGNASVMYNNASDTSTLFLENFGGGGTIIDSAPASHGLTTVLRAQGPSGVCGMNTGGDMACTGQIKSLVSTAGGARKVETYAVQSSENWVEDFGTGELEKGVAEVKIDPAFAETVTADSSYHVFITPNADSKGLYVIRKTASSFEVRESGGGTSSLTFDYRIVGKRRGYETERLTDVTERFNAEQAQLKGRMSAKVRTDK